MSSACGFRGMVALGLFLATISVATAQYGGGSGTAADPYQIHTAEQLNTIGLYRQDYDKHFILMADVAFDSNVPFNSIGSEETPFAGSFEGNNCTVANLYHPDAQDPGMFGFIRSEDPNQPAVARLTLINAGIMGHPLRA